MKRVAAFAVAALALRAHGVVVAPNPERGPATLAAAAHVAVSRAAMQAKLGGAKVLLPGDLIGAPSPAERANTTADMAVEANMTAEENMTGAISPNATEEVVPAPPPGLSPSDDDEKLLVPSGPEHFAPTGPSREVESGFLPPPMPDIQLPSVSLRFEIKNVNYERLEQAVSKNPFISKAAGFLQSPDFQTIDQHEMTLDVGDTDELTNGEALEEAIATMVRNLVAKMLGLTGQIVVEVGTTSPPSHSEVHETIGGAAVVSFVQAVHAANHTQGPGAVALPMVSVRLVPGVDLGNGRGMTTVAIVKIVEIPGTKGQRLQLIADMLREKVIDGSLHETLASSVQLAFHGEAIVGEIDESIGFVTPYNLTACASHVEKIVDGFSQAYTRHQVPHALYHACSNYAQKVSFSHDTIVNKVDRARCRKAAKKFMKMWQYGKGKVDYSSLCLQMCELRHGEDAIRCDSYKYLSTHH